MRLCFISAFLSVLLFAVAADAQSISGTVVDSRGDAVAGAEVTIQSEVKTLRVVTSADGTFAFDEPMAGRLSVTAAGFQPYSVQINTEVGNPLTIVLQPAPVAASVTVTGVEESQDSANVAVITIESLGVTTARTADDTLRQVPGFQLFRRSSSRTTNPTAQGANLRGVAGSGASRATVLFDGLSLNDAFGGWTYWSRVPMIAVEQIEVLQGGGSSVYGSGALSGAVNIVPKELSGTEEFQLNIETSAATQSTADVSGLMLASRGKWRLNVIGDLFRTGGYIPVEESSRGTVDTPASSRYANLIFKVARRFGEDGQVFVRGNRFAEDRDNGTSLTENQTEFYQLAIGADLVSKRYGEFSVRVFGERQDYDQSFSAVAADRNSESLTRLQQVPSRAGGASVQWRKKFADHNASASAAILQTRGFSEEVGFSNGRATSEARAGGNARDISIFAQDLWDVAPKLTLNLSARIDVRNNSDGIATTRSLSNGSIIETRFPNRRDISFSPRIAAACDVSDTVAIYASFSRAFRAPSLNELYRGFRVGNIVTEANEFLTPERSTTIEAGGSVRLFDGRSITRASVFSTGVDDPVVSVTTASTPTLITRVRRNVGSTLSRGFEIASENRLTDTLKLNVNYLYVDAKISDFPADPSLVGNRLPQTAKHNFTLQARYDPRPRWSISTQMRAASSQFEDDRNTLRLREYFTADARVSYKPVEGIEIFAGVENILNSRYDIGRTPVRTVAAPASLRVGLRFSFGGR
ncbi:MAG: TonB-dependent receptor [Pyrinomonadaceae bacterium]|nr:TonB-dependent receptor [Pyrinomonadaceae bacterium]